MTNPSKPSFIPSQESPPDALLQRRRLKALAAGACMNPQGHKPQGLWLLHARAGHSPQFKPQPMERAAVPKICRSTPLSSFLLIIISGNRAWGSACLVCERRTIISAIGRAARPETLGAQPCLAWMVIGYPKPLTRISPESPTNTPAGQ